MAATCQRLGIVRIDPSSALTARLDEGVGVYDDYWTPAGHAVIAEVLAEALAPLAEPRDRR